MMKSNKNAWHIRYYKKNDEKKIFELMKLTYPEKNLEKNEWMRWWKWKYLNNSCKKGMPLILVAEDDNSRIIGHVGFTPIKLKIKGRIVMGAQAVDGMVHPKYRQQGIFLSMMKAGVNSLGEENIFVSYAISRRSSYLGSTKVGFFKATQLKTGLKFLNYKKYVDKNVKNKVLKKIYFLCGNRKNSVFCKGQKNMSSENTKISRIERFDDNINEFWEKISEERNIIVVRDKNYLNYRYCDYVDAEYTIYTAKQNRKIVGYVILKYVEYNGITYGIIQDFIASEQNKKILIQLISKAIEHLRQRKVDVISCLMVADRAVIDVLKSHGFVFSRILMRASKRDSIFIIYDNHPLVPKEFFKNEKNFYFQMGDFDIF